MIKILKKSTFAILVLLILCLCGCNSVGNVKNGPPLARHGVIDLTGWDFQKNGIINLNGEWEFYWQQLLSVDDFQTPDRFAAPTYLALPAAWNTVKLKGEKLGENGFATFRLRILPGTVDHELALSLNNVLSAYKLWANGKLLIEGGVVGRNSSEEIPNRSNQQPRLILGNQPVEIVLQISNHHYREGGVASAIRLGPVDKLETTQLRQWGLTLFCIGSLAVMGVYHIALFYFRRKNHAPLYFGLYCLIWVIFFLTTNSNGRLIWLFIENIPFNLLNRIDLICIVISVPIIFSFLRTLYPEEFSQRLQQISCYMAIIFVFLGLATPQLIFLSAIPVYYLFSIILIPYCLFMLFKALQKKREGALFILPGIIALGIAGTNDMLNDLQLIRSVSLMDTGMLIFILCQACAISLRFSNAFSTVEQLSTEREQHILTLSQLNQQIGNLVSSLQQKIDEHSLANRTLEEQIAERNRLERAIVLVADNERLRISQELHDGLCQQLTGARLHCAALESRLATAGVIRTDLQPLGQLLDEAVNHAYDLSRGLWPLENSSNELSSALEVLVRRMAEQSGIAIKFNQKQCSKECASESLTQIQRIAREAITNAVKHSRADLITVSLQCNADNGIVLEVRDNGNGRDKSSKTVGGMGIGIMKQRATIIGGRLEILDAEGGGVHIVCVAPCSGTPSMENQHVLQQTS